MGQSTSSDTVPVDHDAKLEQLYAEGNRLIAETRAAITKPRVFIISGPSGVGKDAVIEALQKTFSTAHYVVTATTRPIRDNETPNVHYIFLTKEEFETRIANHDFIEHATVYENHYGVPRWPIVEAIDAGRDVIIKVDVQGAAKLRGLIKNAISIFICPETMQALEKRLRDRKTEDRDALMKRFTTATEELRHIGLFDYVVFNEDGMLPHTIKQIQDIIALEHRKVDQPDIRFP